MSMPALRYTQATSQWEQELFSGNKAAGAWSWLLTSI